MLMTSLVTDKPANKPMEAKHSTEDAIINSLPRDTVSVKFLHVGIISGEKIISCNQTEMQAAFTSLYINAALMMGGGISMEQPTLMLL